MARKSCKVIKIGDLFHTWEVIQELKNYKYQCKCINCGSEKTILKYNLLNNSYALCKKCGVKSVLEANISEIMKYWNKDLNNVETPQELLENPSAVYWFTCSKGHNFRKTLKDFDPESCPTCKKQMSHFAGGQPLSKLESESFADCYPHVLEFWNFRKNKDKPKEVFPKTNKKKYWFTCSEGHEFQRTPFEISQGRWCPYCDNHFTESRLATVCKQMFDAMYDNVVTEHQFPIEVEINGSSRTLYPDIIIEDIKLAIEIHGEQHRKFSKMHHGTEANFLDQLDRDKAKKLWLINHGYRYKIIEATNNFEKDIDNLKNFIVELVHKL